VSAFFWGGHPQKVFDQVISGLDELYITDEIIQEIKSVMNGRKFTANSKQIEDYVKIIEKYSKKMDSKYDSKPISRDKDDDKILQCGFDGNVDFIITGDKDLLVLNEYETIIIIKPKDYLAIV
jgi:putative PIN family toxin of toxin-antitoxin system